MCEAHANNRVWREANITAFEAWMSERDRAGWQPLLPEHPESHWVEVFFECS